MKNPKTKFVLLEFKTTLTNVQLRELWWHGHDEVDNCVVDPETVVQVTVNSTPTPKRKKKAKRGK